MKKKIKKPSLAKAKKKAWDTFSLYVRTRKNIGGFTTCITCGRLKSYKKLQAGHFIPGRHNAILFDERGVHPQCYTCNVVLGGNGPKYYEWMLKNYGLAIIKELEALDTTTVIYTVQDFMDIEKKYKELVK